MRYLQIALLLAVHSCFGCQVNDKSPHTAISPTQQILCDYLDALPEDQFTVTIPNITDKAVLKQVMIRAAQKNDFDRVQILAQIGIRVPTKYAELLWVVDQQTKLNSTVNTSPKEPRFDDGIDRDSTEHHDFSLFWD